MEITKSGPFIKKPRNYCVTLLRKIRKAYFEKLNIKEIGDNATLWRTARPYFSDTVQTNKLNLTAPIINTTNNI